MSETKVCNVCKVEKPTTEFFKNRNKAFKDGLSRACKECDYKKTRKYIEANREKSREYHRKYETSKYEVDPEFREKKLASAAAQNTSARTAAYADPVLHEELKAKCREYGKRHYHKHKDRFKKERDTAEWRLQHRVYCLKTKYGLTLAQWEAMEAKNQNKCWICDKENIRGRGGNKLVVDHCHESGKVRGALCDFCNQLLGALGDTIPKLNESIARFIKYLEAAEKFDVSNL